MNRSIRIESPGLLTTVQDFGRYGYQRFGMPVSGAADVFSMQLANLLVGNAQGMAVLEATLTGPQIMMMNDGFAAVCGGGMTPLLNGTEVPAHMTLEVQAGDLLSFEASSAGCRTYIAFDGGLAPDAIMGSRSTYLPAAVGGLQGRPLRYGDTIPLGNTRKKATMRKVPASLLPGLAGPVEVRILAGPESSRMTFEGLKNLITSEYEVASDSDRMGLRLQGKPVALGAPGHQIISSGVVAGTLQVPGNGQPILLLADSQTTGGYARVAVAATVDMPLLAQLRPGDKLSFAEIDYKEASQLLRQRQQLLSGAIK